MLDIYDILDLSRERVDYIASHKAASECDSQLSRSLSDNIKRLKEVTKKMDNAAAAVPNYDGEEVRRVLRKVRGEENNPEKWTPRELRILVYHLGDPSIEADIPAACRLLEARWSDTYTTPLVRYLMEGWHSKEVQALDDVRALLRRKMSVYQGANPYVIAVRDKFRYLEPEGPYRLAVDLIGSGRELIDGPDMLGLPGAKFDQEYFSDTILTFFREKRIADISKIEEILCEPSKWESAAHWCPRTKKLMMAWLVEDATYKDDLRQDRVRACAGRVLKQRISQPGAWASFPRITLEERTQLDHACELVKGWEAKRIVEQFFAKACKKDDREEFWVQYLRGNIRDIKVVGSYDVYNKLKYAPGIGSILQSHFIETVKNDANDQAALVMYFERHTIVEFSNTGGALYVYVRGERDDATKCLDRPQRSLFGNSLPRIGSIKLLRDKTIQDTRLIPDWGRYNEKGRLVHNGDWTGKMSRWLLAKGIQKST